MNQDSDRVNAEQPPVTSIEQYMDEHRRVSYSGVRIQYATEAMLEASLAFQARKYREMEKLGAEEGCTDNAQGNYVADQSQENT